MKRSQLSLLMLLVELGSVSLGVAFADPVPEYAMKAAFLYNFGLFAEWPEPPRGSFNVCVLGHDTFGAALGAIEGKTLQDVPVRTIYLTAPEHAEQCHILYIGETDASDVHRLMRNLGSAPVLTVAEAETPAASDAMITMRLENKHLTFEINQTAAHEHQLVLSSKLLKLARRVY